MVIGEILNKIQYIEFIGSCDTEFNHLSFDSNECVKGSVFFCINGEKLDGHNFALDAVNNGATILFVERKLNIDVCQVIVHDVRKSMASVSKIFYGEPDKKLKIIGITGTNGKTTTSYIIKHILESAGNKVGVIGTNGYSCSDFKMEAKLTTPDSIELFSILKRMVECSVEYVVMEVSAHAIALSKVYGIDFLVGIFTNLTQDHLDFFKDMNNYFEVKKSFLNNCKYKLINSDDELVKTINGENVFSFALNNPADCFAMDLKEKLTGSEFVINLFDNISKVCFSLPSSYNVSNCLAAASCCQLLKIPFNIICSSLACVPKVWGRIEVLRVKNFTVVIDYAHTPDGVEKLLTFVNKFKKRRIISLVGCGGFRDSLKRKEMGRIANELSDIVVVTTDNPRFENGNNIVDDISVLIEKEKCIKEQDRFKAVVTALMQAKKDDIVVLCGKGRENYQDVMGNKIPYNEYDIVMNFNEIKVGVEDD